MKGQRNGEERWGHRGDGEPYVSHPREVRDIPVEWREPELVEGSGRPRDTSGAPLQIEEVHATEAGEGQAVAIVEEDENDGTERHTARSTQTGDVTAHYSSHFDNVTARGLGREYRSGGWSADVDQGWSEDDEDAEMRAALELSLKSKAEEDMVRMALAEGGREGARGEGAAAFSGAAGGAPVGNSAEVPGDDARWGLLTSHNTQRLGPGQPHLELAHHGWPAGSQAGYPHPLAYSVPQTQDPAEDADVDEPALTRRQFPGEEGESATGSASGGPVVGPDLAHLHGPSGELPDGLSPEEIQMAAMYEASFYGVPYVGHPQPACHSVPDQHLPPAAREQHQELSRQWQALQPETPGAAPVPAGLEASADEGGLLATGAGERVGPALRQGGVSRHRVGVRRVTFEDEEEVPVDAVWERAGRPGGGRVTAPWEGDEEEEVVVAPRRRSAVAAPPSPRTLEQRLLREQQDDEYQMSLLADMEKDEWQRREAELAKSRAQEETTRRAKELQAQEEEERVYQALLRVKAARLPPEPEADSPNAITLLVRAPDGTRFSRRFLRSQRLEALLDFIDTQAVMKSGSYELVRQYPRRVFSVADAASSFEDLGLTSRQEALFILRH